MKTVFALLLILASLPEASACRDPLSETQTFFSELPPSVGSKEVVARVKVISTQLSGSLERLTTVKVMTAVKGSKVGAVMKVSTDTSSCNRDPDLRTDQEYFVAGTIGTDGFFRGAWKPHQSNKPK